MINDCVIKFHNRYVDDTIVLIKPSDIPVLAKSNSFDRNLNFTIDTFLDDIDGTDIYRKETHTDVAV